MYILNLIRLLLFVDSRVGRDGFQVDGGHGDEGRVGAAPRQREGCARIDSVADRREAE